MSKVVVYPGPPENAAKKFQSDAPKATRPLATTWVGDALLVTYESEDRTGAYFVARWPRHPGRARARIRRPPARGAKVGSG